MSAPTTYDEFILKNEELLKNRIIEHNQTTHVLHRLENDSFPSPKKLLTLFIEQFKRRTAPAASIRFAFLQTIQKEDNTFAFIYKYPSTNVAVNNNSRFYIHNDNFSKLMRDFNKIDYDAYLGQCYQALSKISKSSTLTPIQISILFYHNKPPEVRE